MNNIKKMIENEEFDAVDDIIRNLGIDYLTAKDLAYMVEHGYIIYDEDENEIETTVDEIIVNNTTLVIKYTYVYDEFIGYDEDGKPDFVKSYAEGEDTYDKHFCTSN